MLIFEYDVTYEYYVLLKNKYIAKKIAEKEKELILVEKEYAATYAVYEEKMKRTAETNTEMYDLKIFERKKNFPVQIERNRKEQKDLNHEVCRKCICYNMVDSNVRVWCILPREFDVITCVRNRLIYVAKYC